MQNSITLRGNWLIRAPLLEIFRIMTDFERWPEYFPKVAESVQTLQRGENRVEIQAKVRSFGRLFPVAMEMHILPGKGFVSDNKSPVFGTSGHESFLLSTHPEGTEIEYTYEVVIHAFWLRLIARPLIGWLAMTFWEKAVIDELKKKLE